MIHSVTQTKTAFIVLKSSKNYHDPMLSFKRIHQIKRIATPKQMLLHKDNAVNIAADYDWV